MLTRADHEHFIDHGYLLLRGVVPAEVLRAAVEVFERPVDKSDPAAVKAAKDAMAQASLSCVSEALLTAVNELHGRAYPVLREQVHPTYIPRLRNPEALHQPAPHMDLIHPTLVPDLWAVGAFVFLSRVRSLGGAFLYAPDSPNRLRALMSANTGEASWGMTKSEKLSGVVQECLADAGDVILFQHTMLHSGSENIEGDTTRHALRFSFTVTPRLAPYGKAFEEMSTIEKINSIRYLRDRYGDSFHVYDVGAADAALAQGAGPVATHDELKLDGQVYRFWTTPEKPALIQRAVGTDFARWTQLAPLELVDDPIVSLHLEHRFNPTLTLVCRNAQGQTWSRVFESSDFDHWRQILGAQAWTLSRPHFLQGYDIGPFMTKRAAGSMFYFVADKFPHEVRWRSGASRYEFDEWPTFGVALKTPSRVTDLWCLPGAAMYLHVLVADMDGASHYTVSHFQDVYETPLQPFKLEQGTASQLRCFERAQGYWLVTYVRDKRVYWGQVDWTNAPGVIEEFTTPAGLRCGLEIVGLS